MVKRIVKFLLCQIRRLQFRRQCRIDPLAIIMGTVTFEGANKVGAHSKVIGTSMGYGSYMGNSNLFPGCKIGRYCSIGSNVEVVSATHPTKRTVSTHPFFYNSAYSLMSYAPTVSFDEILATPDGYHLEMGHDVWIGDHVLIKGGVRIGNGAVIAMGSVVTCDVPPYAIVGGVPARVIKYRFTEEQIEALENIQWWDKPETWIKERGILFPDIDLFLEREGTLHEGM